jgi:hypothetical protein
MKTAQRIRIEKALQGVEAERDALLATTPTEEDVWRKIHALGHRIQGMKNSLRDGYKPDVMDWNVNMTALKFHLITSNYE